MVKRLAISYLIGVTAGSVATYICVKDYYKNIANDEIESVKETTIKRVAALYSAKAEEAIKNFEKSEVDVSSKVVSDDDVKKKEIKDYTSYYNGNAEVPDILNNLAESEFPVEDVPVTKSKKKGKKLLPKIIKAEDYDAYPEYAKVVIFYYFEDGVLADEEEETELEDTTGKKLGKYNDLVGNCISKYGFDTNDETVIYVRNEEIKTDFEIQKDFGAFADIKGED